MYPGLRQDSFDPTTGQIQQPAPIEGLVTTLRPTGRTETPLVTRPSYGAPAPAGIVTRPAPETAYQAGITRPAPITAASTALRPTGRTETPLVTQPSDGALETAYQAGIVADAAVLPAAGYGAGTPAPALGPLPPAVSLAVPVSVSHGGIVSSRILSPEAPARFLLPAELIARQATAVRRGGAATAALTAPARSYRPSRHPVAVQRGGAATAALTARPQSYRPYRPLSSRHPISAWAEAVARQQAIRRRRR